jgi:PIN domain nuclease of toxin-antitoxin system
MRLLCDTSILLNMAAGVSSREARTYLEDPDLTLCYSSAGIWEVAIKNMLGKLPIGSRVFERLLNEAGFSLIDIRVNHIQEINNLKDMHKDPFDRLMVAQAISEGISFLTTDATLTGYHPCVIPVPK